MMGDIFHTDAAEIENLATRQNSGQYFVLFGGSQDKFDIWRRLFQRFQECVKSRGRKHMNLINNIHFVLPALRRDAHLINQGTNIVNRVIGSCIELINIKRSRTIEWSTWFTLIAGFTLGRKALTINGFGHNPGTSSLANSTRTGKQKSLCNLLIADGIFKRIGNRCLTYNGCKRCGTVFSGWNYKAVHWNSDFIFGMSNLHEISQINAKRWKLSWVSKDRKSCGVWEIRNGGFGIN